MRPSASRAASGLGAYFDRELDADLLAGRVEALGEDEIGGVVFPGHEEAAVGERRDVRLVPALPLCPC